MTTPTTADLLKYADVQMAAEAFLVDGDIVKTGNALRQALIDGNNHASKFTPTQADNFLARWSVVAQKANTATGFSGTLFRNKDTGELVVSMRSTEFIDDAARDNQATNVLEVREFGWAFGQIDDMKQWVDGLYASGKISNASPVSVTGYSLGGHLATAFNLLYPGVPQATYTFNGAGVGKVTYASAAQADGTPAQGAKRAACAQRMRDTASKTIASYSISTRARCRYVSTNFGQVPNSARMAHAANRHCSSTRGGRNSAQAQGAL